MAKSNSERLASIETKLDMIRDMINGQGKRVESLNGRLRNVENQSFLMSKIGRIGFTAVLFIVALLSIINTVATWAK